MIINFLEETKEAIEDSGHEIEDVVYIGSENAEYGCTWHEFLQLVNVEYDPLTQNEVVPVDLIVVFSDGQTMWRDDKQGGWGVTWAIFGAF